METDAAQADVAVLHKDRHAKYWLRCLRSLLPNAYIPNESSRMTLAFFTISALDILGILHTSTSITEREGWADWIYQCQLASGGFRGFPGADFGSQRSVENEAWDPANLAATFFTLATLVVLGDDLERVRRAECLQWLQRLQRQDGSFGELLGEEGKIVGGRDMRYCYMATGVRWMLRGRAEGAKAGGKDIDVDALVGFINSSEVVDLYSKESTKTAGLTPIFQQTYDHSIGESPYHEAHAGMTFCGIGALSLLNRLPEPLRDVTQEPSKGGDAPVLTGLSSLEGTVRWLVERQTGYFPAEDDESEEEDEGKDTDNVASGLQQHETTGAGTDDECWPHEIPYAGFSGRRNKDADTCYSFWAGGSLAILKKISLINADANRRFLLKYTQRDVIGGFGKLPGHPPDILHSYLGLAALSIMEEPGLLSLDPTMCITVRARNYLVGLPWWQGE
ncbi:MAG: hypothetical protein M1839_006004 [Geoglossum umbratile]|nr:MAG: hypothetical protein M1839_006004 [Geoglossum umbratile]